MDFSAIQRLMSCGMFVAAHNACILAGWNDDAKAIANDLSAKGYMLVFDVDGMLIEYN